MEKAKLRLLAMLCLLFAGVVLYAQQGVIVLRNASFEDAPRHSQTPRDWIDCGFSGESEPDTQPCGEFGVTMLPLEGDTYLGMVVRDNETWERVSQRLSSPLEGGKCYEFSIHLARSPQYLSQSRITEQLVNYNKGIRLRVYAGFSPCSRQELLAQSSVIKNSTWQRFNFTLEPTQNYTFIIFEAFYEDSKLEPYNGNILLDNASAIVPTICNDTISSSIKTNFLDTIAVRGSILPPPTPVVAPKFVKGESLPLKAIKFSPGTDDLQRSGYATLDKLIETLTLNPTLVVKISVHISYRYKKADPEDLCIQRVMTIEKYLLDKLVKKNRFKMVGIIDGDPFYTEEPNDDVDERVEIKIDEF